MLEIEIVAFGREREGVLLGERLHGAISRACPAPCGLVSQMPANPSGGSAGEDGGVVFARTRHPGAMLTRRDFGQ